MLRELQVQRGLPVHHPPQRKYSTVRTPSSLPCRGWRIGGNDKFSVLSPLDRSPRLLALPSPVSPPPDLFP